MANLRGRRIGWRGRNTAAHEVYDPAANRWTALAYVPTARDHLGAAAIDERLYAVGGRIDGNYSRNLTSNEAYDPATDRWEQHAPMPTARSGIAAAVLEGRMFVFGGEAPSGTFNQAEVYDAKSNGRRDMASARRRWRGGSTSSRRASARRLGFGGQRDFRAVTNVAPYPLCSPLVEHPRVLAHVNEGCQLGHACPSSKRP
jgi:N-acetylneuraminic acid mutarotase